MTHSRDLNKFIVRFPEGMRDRLTVEAKKSTRSMNSELVARLRESFEPSLPKLVLRDQFAAKALLGLLAEPGDHGVSLQGRLLPAANNEEIPQKFAELSYLFADAMLAVREK